MSNILGERLHCVGTGFIALDIIRSALDQHTIIERRYAGGTCGNVLAILSFLGLGTSAVGRIGDDPIGGELLRDLRRLGVDARFLFIEADQRTPVVFQESFTDARGRARHRFSRSCPVCGTSMPGYRPLLSTDVTRVADALPNHKIFFFDRVSPGTLQLARRSREQGALVVFEPSGIKDEHLFGECLSVSHILKYSRERLYGLETFTQMSTVPLVIETLGSKGLRFRMGALVQDKDWRYMAALPAPSLRDTAGSGDWCTAGFLARVMARSEGAIPQLTDTKTIIEGLVFGQALASMNCAYDGARGLMYAMDHSSVLTAAEQLLTRQMPILPQGVSPERLGTHSNTACVVCSSDLSVVAT